MKTGESSKLWALWSDYRELTQMGVWKRTSRNRRVVKREASRARRRVDRSVIQEQAIP